MKHFIKTQLYFNRRERNGIVVLVVLLGLMTGVLAFRKYQEPSQPETFEDFLSQVESLRDSIELKHIKQDRPVPVLFRFDPNQVSALDLEKLGAPSFIADRIVRYRAKGGLFRRSNDLYRIYGIDSSLVESWLPYVLIEERVKEKESEVKPRKKDTLIVVELNTADTTDLISIPGIGAYFAKHIIEYRDALRGFRDVRQLMEIYLIDSVKFAAWDGYLSLDVSHCGYINVNEASISELGKHPYIGNRIAKAIVKYREQHGDFRSLNELQKSYLIDEAIFRKIAPYLAIQ